MSSTPAMTGPNGTEQVRHVRFRPCPDPLCQRGAICTREPLVIGHASNGEPVYSTLRTTLQCVICPTCQGRGQLR